MMYANGVYDGPYNPNYNGNPTLIPYREGLATQGTYDQPAQVSSAPQAPAPYVAPVKLPPALNQAAVNNTQLTIDQLPALLQAALQAESQRYQNTVGDFRTQETQQRGTYDKSTQTNQLNYDANYMDSIRAGSRGLSGLMQLLRGTGAAGGSVDDEVRDIVGGITAQDIRTGADTQKDNQTSLDGSLGAFLTDLERKRRVNEDTRVNNERAITRDNQTQMQDLFGKMAGFYGDAERLSERDAYMARAGELTPSIAANSAARVSNYDTAPVAVQAPQVTAFAGNSQPNSIVAPTDGQVGSGLFTMNRRRDPNALAVAGV